MISRDSDLRNLIERHGPQARAIQERRRSEQYARAGAIEQRKLSKIRKLLNRIERERIACLKRIEELTAKRAARLARRRAEACGKAGAPETVGIRAGCSGAVGGRKAMSRTAGTPASFLKGKP